MRAAYLFSFFLFAIFFLVGVANAAEQRAVDQYQLNDIDYFELKIPPDAEAKKNFLKKILESPQCVGTGDPRVYPALEPQHGSYYTVPKDNKIVFSAFLPKSSIKSDPKACYNRGVGILKGDFDNITVDDVNRRSVLELFRWPDSSRIEEKRLVSAFFHFIFAAEKGFTPAQYAVGLMLHNGYEVHDVKDGESKTIDNDALAYKWLLIAVDTGFEKAISLLSTSKQKYEKAAQEEAERQRRMEEGKRKAAERQRRQEEANRLQAEKERQARAAQAAADVAAEAAAVVEKQRIQAEAEAEKQRLQAEREHALIVAEQKAAADAARYKKLLTSNKDAIIRIIQESWLVAYPQDQKYPPVGQAFNSFFENPQWEFQEAANRRWLVIFTGIGILDGQKGKMQLTFQGESFTEEQLRNKEIMFSLRYLSIDGAEKNNKLNDTLVAIFLN